MDSHQGPHKNLILSLYEVNESQLRAESGLKQNDKLQSCTDEQHHSMEQKYSSLAKDYQILLEKNERLHEQNKHLQEFKQSFLKQLNSKTISTSKSNITSSSEQIVLQQILQSLNTVDQLNMDNENLKKQLQSSRQRQISLQKEVSEKQEQQNQTEKKLSQLQGKFQKFKEQLQSSLLSISRSRIQDDLYLSDAHDHPNYTDKFNIEASAKQQIYFTIPNKKKTVKIQQTLSRLLSDSSISSIYPQRFKEEMDQKKKENQELRQKLQAEQKLCSKYSRVIRDLKDKLSPGSQISTESSISSNSQISHENFEYYKRGFKIYKSKYLQQKKKQKSLEQMLKRLKHL